MRNPIGPRLAGALLLVTLGGAAAAQGAGPPAAPPREAAVALELNKLEPITDGCRAYFVATNGLPEPIRDLRLDTFIFGASGVVSRRILLAFPDLRPGRAKVVPFDLAGSDCGEIGRLLVNDVLACTGATGGPVAGCPERLATTTRAKAALDY